VPKFHCATPSISEVIGARLLNFKPISDPPFEKNYKGDRWTETPFPGGGCASKTWPFYSKCKNLKVQHPLGPKCGLPSKSIRVGMISHQEIRS